MVMGMGVPDFPVPDDGGGAAGIFNRYQGRYGNQVVIHSYL